MNSRHHRRQAGFSSVEAILVLALLGSATLAMTHSVISGHRGLQYVEDDTKILNQAQIIMSRLVSMPFGSQAEAPPNILAILQLMIIENDVFGSPLGTAYQDPNNPLQYYSGTGISLSQVSMMPMPLTWTYDLAGKNYYGGDGTWEIIVDRDINGDGDLLDPMEVATQTTLDLMRVEIRYDGARVIRTIRSRDPAQ